MDKIIDFFNNNQGIWGFIALIFTILLWLGFTPDLIIENINLDMIFYILSHVITFIDRFQTLIAVFLTYWLASRSHSPLRNKGR